MPARVNIELYSDGKLEKEDVEFFSSEVWTSETEGQLLQRMHELITELRPVGKSFYLKLNIEVTDLNAASVIINKSLHNGNGTENHKLSHREAEIVSLIMTGYTTKEIADKLCISYETVKSHRKNILDKTGAKNAASLINYYHNTFHEK